MSESVSRSLSLSLSLVLIVLYVFTPTSPQNLPRSHGRFADKTAFVARTVRSGAGAVAAAAGEDRDRTAMDANATRAARSECDDSCSGLRELVLSYNKGELLCIHR